MRTLGPDMWAQTMARVEAPIFVLGEYLVFAAFGFHAVNGIRLVLLELGISVGKPIEPVYPYRTSVHHQRPLAIAAMLLAVVVAALGGLNLLSLHQ